MGEVRPIPTLGGAVRDVRGAGRALRVSWHREDGLVVLSLWDGPRCTGTVRVATTDVPALIEALQIGLRPEPVASADQTSPTTPPAHGTPGPDAPPGGLDVVTDDPEDGVAG